MSIVENACLLHDIGNPPFDHFGETAIRSSNQMEGIYSTRKELKDMLINNTPKNYKRFSGI